MIVDSTTFCELCVSLQQLSDALLALTTSLNGGVTDAMLTALARTWDHVDFLNDRLTAVTLAQLERKHVELPH